MAKILFLDSDPLALKAFAGIIGRSVHKMLPADSSDKAWAALQDGPFFDLIVMEIKLADGKGRAFLAGLRKHPYLKSHPVVVYTKAHDRETVRKTVELGVQNYLFKPYEDEKLFEEIRKASGEPWWKKVFEPAEKVLARFVDPPLPESLADVHKALLKDLRSILESLQNEWGHRTRVALAELRKSAEKAGFPALASETQKLLACEHPAQIQLQTFCEEASVAARLLKESAFPDTVAGLEFGIGQPERRAAPPAKPQLPRGAPTGKAEDIFEQLSALPGYPVVESVAASFQMAAANPEIEVETLAGMILADPCLSVQVYHHVNHVSELARKTQDGVREQKHAIQLLGLTRIRKMASGLLAIPDDELQTGGFNWKQYRSFQVGCGMLAEQLVQMLSLQANPSTAYFAGLVHELGKILLAYLYPKAYRDAIALSQEANISLSAAEAQKFGCSSQKAGAFFAELSKFSPEYIDTIRFYTNPEAAPRYSAVMAAVVSMADHICKVHGVGFSGSRVARGSAPLHEHPSWQVLQGHVGPMFSIHRFEREAGELVRRIQARLAGA